MKQTTRKITSKRYGRYGLCYLAMFWRCFFTAFSCTFVYCVISSYALTLFGTFFWTQFLSRNRCQVFSWSAIENNIRRLFITYIYIWYKLPIFVLLTFRFQIKMAIIEAATSTHKSSKCNCIEQIFDWYASNHVILMINFWWIFSLLSFASYAIFLHPFFRCFVY